MKVEYHATHHTPQVVEEFIRVCERITYKPHHRLVVRYDVQTNHILFDILAPVINANDWNRDHQRCAEVSSPSSISAAWLQDTSAEPHFDRDDLPPVSDFERRVIFTVGSAIRRYELHEMDEWLRFDGHHVKDPHPRR